MQRRALAAQRPGGLTVDGIAEDRGDQKDAEGKRGHPGGLSLRENRTRRHGGCGRGKGQDQFGAVIDTASSAVACTWARVSSDIGTMPRSAM